MRAHDASELALKRIQVSPRTYFLVTRQQFEDNFYITLSLPATRCTYTPTHVAR